jgi:hypothetical protein
MVFIIYMLAKEKETFVKVLKYLSSIPEKEKEENPVIATAQFNTPSHLSVPVSYFPNNHTRIPTLPPS